jgi:8-oxo-dGTP pyrophosphatase MutT (NUDIX family)
MIEKNQKISKDKKIKNFGIPILSQAKMIDIKRLTRKIGSLDEENFIKLNQKFIKYYKYESPISGAISEAEAINTNNISNSQNKSNEKFRIFKLSQQTVFLNEEYQVLALKKTRENTWLLPGGRVDDGELNLENALKREIKEELSLEDFDILQPIGIDQSNGKSTLAVAYLCKSKSLHKITLSPEHEEYKWLNKNDLEKYLYYKNIAREIIKYIEKISK